MAADQDEKRPRVGFSISTHRQYVVRSTVCAACCHAILQNAHLSGLLVWTTLRWLFTAQALKQLREEAHAKVIASASQRAESAPKRRKKEGGTAEKVGKLFLCRICYVEATNVHVGQKTPPPTDPLTVEEDLAIQRHYMRVIEQFCAQFKFPAQVTVRASPPQSALSLLTQLLYNVGYCSDPI